MKKFAVAFLALAAVVFGQSPVPPTGGSIALGFQVTGPKVGGSIPPTEVLAAKVSRGLGMPLVNIAFTSVATFDKLFAGDKVVARILSLTTPQADQFLVGKVEYSLRTSELYGNIITVADIKVSYKLLTITGDSLTVDVIAVRGVARSEEDALFDGLKKAAEQIVGDIKKP